MSLVKALLRVSGMLYFLRVLRRAKVATSYFNFRYRQIWRWLWTSNEDSNFTYSLTRGNLLELCQCVSVVTKKPLADLERYLSEVLDNSELKSHVAELTQASPQKDFADSGAEFGRRLGWYLFVRAIKPKVVVETGIDKGLGSLLLSYALLRNREEGATGEYFGTDINPNAGYLLRGKYAEIGKILYGDSIDSLSALNRKIDLFINDSEHSAEYEYAEYQIVKDKLSDFAVILGDNAHVTDKLSAFAKETNRSFLFFREVPENHWYPGGGIGIAFSSGKSN